MNPSKKELEDYFEMCDLVLVTRTELQDNFHLTHYQLSAVFRAHKTSFARLKYNEIKRRIDLAIEKGERSVHDISWVIGIPEPMLYRYVKLIYGMSMKEYLKRRLA